MGNDSRWILKLLAPLGAAVFALGACASGDKHPAPVGAGADAASGATASGEGAQSGDSAGDAGAGHGGRGGSSNDPPGGETSGGAGAGDAAGGNGPDPAGAAGHASGGEGMIPDGPFTGPDPFPCESDNAEPPNFSADCALTGAWGAGEAVASEAAEGASLIGVTPDELTLVWSEARGSEPHYYFADRSSPGEAFGSAQEVAGGHLLAVSPNGLRLVALSADQSALLSLSRSDRASAFGAAAEDEFSLLDEDARAKGWSFSSCALSPDDRTLFYTVGAGDTQHPLRVSKRDDTGPWPVGEQLDQCEFEAHGGYGRYPTGVSADGKTLFFYDSWRGMARAAWRESTTSAFTWFRDLEELIVSQPNAACNRLYYTVADPASHILSAPAE
jgi:hypothetical protein